MNFNERLNGYLQALGCTAKDLAKAAGISSAAISRYRNGSRTPEPGGRQVRQLAHGIAVLSDGMFDEVEVLEDLVMSISGIGIGHDTFLANLNALVDALGMRRRVFALELNFDASYISRIFSGQRRPASMRDFVAGVSKAIVVHMDEVDDGGRLIRLVGEDWRAISDDDERAKAVAHWLISNENPLPDPVEAFLERIASFDVENYIRSVSFDDLIPGTLPEGVPVSRSYQGIEAMMTAELDYLSATVASPSDDDVIMYTDMPMREMASYPDFIRRWVFGMVQLLKKGLRLHVIHNTARPLPELVLGLEAWIPMYMTGQVTPYGYDQVPDVVFSHLLKSSGSVALWGEAIVGHQGEGRYILVDSPEEVSYYRHRAELMLEAAKPLMRILTAADVDELRAIECAETRNGGDWRFIFATLPIATASAELVASILDRNGVTGAFRDDVLEFAAKRAECFQAMIASGEVILEVPELDAEEFAQHPIGLELSGLFSERVIAYTYDEYVAHMRELEQLAQEHETLTLKKDREAPFRNMCIVVHRGKGVLVSKNTPPAIHFVIEQPDLVYAFEHFTPSGLSQVL